MSEDSYGFGYTDLAAPIRHYLDEDDNALCDTDGTAGINDKLSFNPEGSDRPLTIPGATGAPLPVVECSDCRKVAEEASAGDE